MKCGLTGLGGLARTSPAAVSVLTKGVALLGASAAGAFLALGSVIATLLAIPILNEWLSARRVDELNQPLVELLRLMQ